jgi:hypothetical protein
MLPLFVVVNCGEDDPNAPKGNKGGESAAGEGGLDGDGGDSGGSAGTGRGGTGGGKGGASTGGASGESGEAGTGGGSDGNGGSTVNGGAAGRGGVGGAGNAGGGRGGFGGNAGNAGGSGGMTCTTMTLPLVNGDFEDGASGWTQYDEEAGAVRPIIVTAASVGIMAESEPNVAHLGGVDGAAAGMFQAIEIPEGATSITLTGYARVVTQEASSAPIDVLTVQLYEDAETATGLVGDFAVLSNEDPSDEWVAFTGTLDVSAHAGHSLELDVWAEADESLVTEFYVDSLAGSVDDCN